MKEEYLEIKPGGDVLILADTSMDSEELSGLEKGIDNERRYACTICDRTFSRKDHLKKHMQHHTGNFSFNCEICQKGFSNSHHYKTHMMAHEGIKYKCQFCSKAFNMKQSLNYHLSEHTGKYRYTCDICGKGYNEQRRLQKHVESHLKHLSI